MANRVPDTSLPENFFVPRQVLTAAQLNQVYELLKAGVNANYEDVKRILNVSTTSVPDGTFEYIKGNTDPTTLPTAPGTIYYDITKHTYVFNGTLGNKHEIGQNLEGLGKRANVDPWKKFVYKDAMCVSWYAAQGDHKIFVPANANDVNRSTMVGVLTTVPTVDTDYFAVVSVFGEVGVNDFRDIMENNDDSGLTFGSKLYLSANPLWSGRYTTTIPERPNAAIWVGSVVSYNPANHKGILFIYPVRERVDGGNLQIFYQNTQPTNMIEGDLWYDTTG